MQGWALGNDRRRPVVEARKKTLLARGFHKHWSVVNFSEINQLHKSRWKEEEHAVVFVLMGEKKLLLDKSSYDFISAWLTFGFSKNKNRLDNLAKSTLGYLISCVGTPACSAHLTSQPRIYHSLPL